MGKRCVRLRRTLRAALVFKQLGNNAVVAEEGSNRKRTVAVAVDRVLVGVCAQENLKTAKCQVM